MKEAVVGIGSNSVRMLLAEIEGNKGVRLLRDRAGTRLFAGLDENGCLTPEAMERAISTVMEMVHRARLSGAETVDLFATSASRDAANGAEFAARLSEMAGTELHIISGEEEAALSFHGATSGERSGMIDIGGGSTEIVVGQGTELENAFSCQMGAVRLFRQYELNSREDIPTVVDAAKKILEEKLQASPIKSKPSAWVGVGGTFTTLAAMVSGVAWTNRTYMNGTRITLDQVREQA